MRFKWVGWLLVMAATATAEDYYGKAPIVPSTLTVTAIQSALEAKSPPFSTVETFLKWVQQEHPAQLTGYTLMRRSRSLQGASGLNPRAIVFGTDARFIFTFNGHPEQKGFGRVEIIAFREPMNGTQGSWEFRELSFGGSSPRLSPPNPAKCARCHQSPLHPLWAAYDNWPGAYGEVDDALIDFRNDKYAKLSKDDAYIKPRLEELDEYREFQAARAKHERYRYLAVPEGSPVSPYNTQIRSGYQFRPNLRFTELIAPLQARHLFRWVKSDSKRFEKYRAALTASLIPSCNAHMKKDYAGRLTQARAEFLASLPSAQLKGWERSNYLGSDWDTAWMLGAFGMEHTDFSLAPEPKYWSYFVGADYLNHYLAQELYDDLGKKDKRYQPVALSTYRDNPSYTSRSTEVTDPESGEKPPLVFTRETACRLLQQDDQARAGFDSQEAFIPPALSPVAMCLTCHGEKKDDDAKTAPRLLLEDPKALSSGQRAEIWSRIASEDPTRRMPPERALSEKEKWLLKEYLK